MTFHVGQKVVCVDDDNPCSCGCSIGIKSGNVYTVTAAFEGTAWGGARKQKVFVAEDTPRIGWENGYLASRFRPVIERKTDAGMAILREVADDASKKRQLVE